MLVFVSTKETQKARESDFCWVDEGELVTFGFACDSDGDDIDGGCGCQRSMIGVVSRKATTTFKVVEKPITPAELGEIFADSLERAGWGKIMGKEGTEEIAETDVNEITRIAATFEAGTILEKRGDVIQARS